LSSNTLTLQPQPLLTQFISRLKQLGIQLQVVDNRLRVKGYAHYLLPPIKHLLLTQKKAIMQLLTQAAPAAQMRASLSAVNEPLPAIPAIRLSVWDVTLSDGKSMTVLSRDEHTLEAMQRSMQRQFGVQRVAHILLQASHA